jgi:hypothetical protein
VCRLEATVEKDTLSGSLFVASAQSNVPAFQRQAEGEGARAPTWTGQYGPSMVAGT